MTTPAQTIGPTVRYPPGPITPHGAYHTLKDRIPLVALRAYDDSIVFNMMGGAAIADRTMPERVELKSMSGLIPPWQTIDQKGASQDGTSFVDALYDSLEVQLGVKAHGRDPAHLRKVVSDLVASIDAKKVCELSWFTHRMGYWWADVRWAKVPDDAVANLSTCSQEMNLRLRSDNAFWQSYPNVDQFRFTYEDDADTFDYLTAPGDPLTGWTTTYSGGGSGVVYTENGEAVSTLIGGRSAILRRSGYTAATNNTVIEIELGTNPAWQWTNGTYVDVWARMNNTGTLGQDGIRWRLSMSSIKLSHFVSGVETVIRDIPLGSYFLWWYWYWPPAAGEKFTFYIGLEGATRTYRVLRNGAEVATVKETGATSMADAAHRRVGFGMSSTVAVRPLGLRSFTVGDNSTVAQEGFLTRINVGDQPMWDRYTCFGPGIFSFGNGPGSNEMVSFGPLLPNQIMQVRTDPRKRGVIDMTAIPPTPQEVALFSTASNDFFSFLRGTRGVIVPTASIFGIQAPQGNPYSLLKGRWSNPIPARSPGRPVEPYAIKCAIDNGTSQSQIIAAGTPLRRLPY